MIKSIDQFLNSITMYRLLLYGLLIVIGIAVIFGFTGTLDQSGVEVLISVGILCATCYYSNILLAWFYGIPVNLESSLITALILVCILPPPTTVLEGVVIAFTGLVAMASKYVLTIKSKHVFNPAAIAAALVSLSGIGFTTWWIGSSTMLPFVLIYGFLVMRKIRREKLVVAFLVVALAVLLWLGFADGRTVGQVAKEAFTSWPLLFFATIMLTEPLTTPPRHRDQMVYGALAAVLMTSRWHVGQVYSTPAVALVLANIYSYVVSPKQRLILTLKEKIQRSANVYDFIFSAPEALKYKAGQYLELTFPHSHPDARGNRRYFTIASSPTEANVAFGIKFYTPSSSFKSALLQLQPGTPLLAGSVSGDFVLPADPRIKIAFLAGGIGVTPFRSMIAYLNDTGEHRDLTMLYAINETTDTVYADVFDRAKQVGVKTVYIVRNENLPASWPGRSGVVTSQVIQEEIPDYSERLFYIAGANIFVEASKKALKELGVSKYQIITDYFPGY